MVGLRKLIKAFAVAVKACANVLLTAGFACMRFAANLEKFAASK